MSEEEKAQEIQEKAKEQTEEASKSLLQKTEEAIKRLEEANLKTEELVSRQEALKAQELLGGKSNAGEPVVKEKQTDEELVKAFENGEESLFK